MVLYVFLLALIVHCSCARFPQPRRAYFASDLPTPFVVEMLLRQAEPEEVVSKSKCSGIHCRVSRRCSKQLELAYKVRKQLEQSFEKWGLLRSRQGQCDPCSLR